MSAFLNTIVFSVFIYWFWHWFVINRKKNLIGLAGLYLLASILVFAFSLFIRRRYLDGLDYLISGLVSIVAFWLCATVLVIWKNIVSKTNQRTFSDLLQLLPLILIPLLIILSLRNESFKIGG